MNMKKIVLVMALGVLATACNGGGGSGSGNPGIDMNDIYLNSWCHVQESNSGQYSREVEMVTFGKDGKYSNISLRLDENNEIMSASSPQGGDLQVSGATITLIDSYTEGGETKSYEVKITVNRLVKETEADVSITIDGETEQGKYVNCNQYEFDESDIFSTDWRF